LADAVAARNDRPSGRVSLTIPGGEAPLSDHRFSDVTLRASDKTLYNKMKEHDDIRFKVKKVEKSWEKVFILIQVGL
jgi:hypothetical protein